MNGNGNGSVGSHDHLSVGELAALIASLERKRVEKIEAAKRDLVNHIREQAAAIGVSIEDLMAALTGAKSTHREDGKLPVKFRGPKPKQEWTGRGKTPTWLAEEEARGRRREEFAV